MFNGGANGGNTEQGPACNRIFSTRSTYDLYVGSRLANLRYRESIDNTVKRNRGTYKPIESNDV